MIYALALLVNVSLLAINMYHSEYGFAIFHALLCIIILAFEVKK